MKLYLAIGALVLIGPISWAQNNTELKKTAHKLIERATACNFLTVDKTGKPVARIMDATAPNEDFEIWLATNPNSRKVKEIKDNQSASIYYINTVGNAYVLLKGKAKLVNKTRLKKKHWKNTWSPYYSQWAEMTLIHFQPSVLEIVNTSAGIESDEHTWRPASIKL